MTDKISHLALLVEAMVLSIYGFLLEGGDFIMCIGVRGEHLGEIAISPPGPLFGHANPDKQKGRETLF